MKDSFLALGLPQGECCEAMPKLPLGTDVAGEAGYPAEPR